MGPFSGGQGAAGPPALEPEVRSAVDRLIDAVRDRPTELPVAELAAIGQTGHRVEASLSTEGDRTNAVVYVAPVCGIDLQLLTGREREVAALVVGGYSNQQIARGLSMSIHTVKDHVHAILAKTGLESRHQLIAAWHGSLRDPERP